MDADSRVATVRSLDRIYLRWAADTFAQIDAACDAPPGSVSRNTWISETVEEKFARDRQGAAASTSERGVHG